MTSDIDIFDIYSFSSNGNWTGDTDCFTSKAVNLCNLIYYQNAYASDGLDIYHLLSGQGVYDMPDISVVNLQQHISTELQKRGIPIVEILIKDNGSTLDMKILISNKRASAVQLLLE